MKEKTVIKNNYSPKTHKTNPAVLIVKNLNKINYDKEYDHIAQIT